jgi:hypothetical protein
MESSVLAVTAAGLLALDHGSIRHPYYRSYLGRNYFSRRRGYRAVPIASSSVAIPIPNCHEAAPRNRDLNETLTGHLEPDVAAGSGTPS